MGKLKTLAYASILSLLITGTSYGVTAKFTAYNDNERDSIPYHHLNCMGTRLKVGQCAADLRYHKLGDKICVKGLGTFVISDCGSKIIGRNRYDIYVSSLREVETFGVKYLDVTTLSDNNKNRYVYNDRCRRFDYEL
jgi:3D (Asp-Asp-Asp) domain-containing protein